MKILVAGGAGFIGSHLCERLLADGAEVIAVDNLLTGSLDNIAHLKKNGRFSFKRADVCRPLKIKGKLDAVLHFASPASPIDYANHPLETLQAGSLATFNLLDLAKSKGARFLFASTSEVYGDPDVSPQREDYWGRVNPIGPRSCYDEAKRFSEALIVNYRKVHKIDARLIRIFNTYGPRMRINDGRAVPNFIFQALARKPLTVYGNGKQTRSFCYVSDLVEGIVRMLYSRRRVSGPVNLGNPKEMTLLRLAKTVNELTGNKSGIIYRPLPQDDPKQRRPDIRLASRELSWRPEVRLEEGLERTIEWFRGKIT